MVSELTGLRIVAIKISVQRDNPQYSSVINEQTDMSDYLSENF